MTRDSFLVCPACGVLAFEICTCPTCEVEGCRDPDCKFTDESPECRTCADDPTIDSGGHPQLPDEEIPRDG